MGAHHGSTCRLRQVTWTALSTVDVIRSRKMDYKTTFSKMIQDGAFDRRLYHGIGHRRVWRHGVEQLRAATDRLVADGRMTPEEQRELLKELAQRIADRFAR